MIAASERSDTTGTIVGATSWSPTRTATLARLPGDPIEVIGTEAELEAALCCAPSSPRLRATSMRKAPRLRVADGLTFDEDRDLRRRVRVVRPPEHAVGVDLVDREAQACRRIYQRISARPGPGRRPTVAGVSGYRRAMRRLFGGGRAAPAEPDCARNLTAVRPAPTAAARSSKRCSRARSGEHAEVDVPRGVRRPVDRPRRRRRGDRASAASRAAARGRRRVAHALARQRVRDPPGRGAPRRVRSGQVGSPVGVRTRRCAPPRARPR